MRNKLIKTLKILLIILVTSIGMYFLSICYRNFSADVNYQKSLEALDMEDYKNAYDYAENAIKLNPMEPNYFRMRARVLISLLPNKSASDQYAIKKQILQDLTTAFGLNPHNLVTIRNIIPMYYFLATKNILVGASPENVDKDYFPYTSAFYYLVEDISPNDVGMYALLAKYERRLNMKSSYEYTISKVKELRPDLLNWFEAFK